MNTSYYEPKYANDSDYDNIFGIKIFGKGKEKRQAKRQARDDKSAKKDKKAGRGDGTRFANILSGAGSLIESGTGLFSAIKGNKSQPADAPVGDNAPEKSNTKTYLIIGGAVLFVVIIVVVIVVMKKKS